MVVMTAPLLPSLVLCVRAYKNRIGDRGAAAVAQLLLAQRAPRLVASHVPAATGSPPPPSFDIPVLEEVHLSHNRIQGPGARALLTAAARCGRYPHAPWRHSPGDIRTLMQSPAASTQAIGTGAATPDAATPLPSPPPLRPFVDALRAAGPPPTLLQPHAAVSTIPLIPLWLRLELNMVPAQAVLTDFIRDVAPSSAAAAAAASTAAPPFSPPAVGGAAAAGGAGGSSTRASGGLVCFAQNRLACTPSRCAHGGGGSGSGSISTSGPRMVDGAPPASAIPLVHLYCFLLQKQPYSEAPLLLEAVARLRQQRAGAGTTSPATQAAATGPTRLTPRRLAAEPEDEPMLRPKACAADAATPSPSRVASAAAAVAGAIVAVDAAVLPRDEAEKEEGPGDGARGSRKLAICTDQPTLWALFGPEPLVAPGLRAAPRTSPHSVCHVRSCHPLFAFGVFVRATCQILASSLRHLQVRRQCPPLSSSTRTPASRWPALPPASSPVFSITAASDKPAAPPPRLPLVVRYHPRHRYRRHHRAGSPSMTCRERRWREPAWACSTSRASSNALGAACSACRSSSYCEGGDGGRGEDGGEEGDERGSRAGEGSGMKSRPDGSHRGSKKCGGCFARSKFRFVRA